jgi:hydrogenase maturation protease
VIVIGVGNEFRHDDAVGLIAARRLRELGVAAEEVEPGVAILADRWNGVDGVVLVDAVSSGAAPGTIHQLDVSASPVPSRMFKDSTHALGLAEAIEMSRLLGTLPRRVMILGIEGEDFSYGVGLSTTVEGALSRLVQLLLNATLDAL